MGGTSCGGIKTKAPYRYSVVEHIGLGRYGDAIDYDGGLKAINELKRVVKPGGQFLFVVPIRKPVIQFNAHRIYDYSSALQLFDDFSLKEFSLILDRPLEAGLIANATKQISDQQNYGCGCFWFVKNVA